MPRRPEIGNIQLYPNRPLTDEDKNGYTLKFFCPIRKKRVRKNCGTRDRREARRILRDCQERVIGRFKTSHSWALQNQQRCECSVSVLKLVFRARGIAASLCFD